MASKVNPSIAQIHLISILRELPDPRADRTQHHLLEDILVIAICTLLCGGESFEEIEMFGEAKEEWFRTFLKLPHGIPSHDTFNRLFAALNLEKFLEALMRWTEACSKQWPRRSSPWIARHCIGLWMRESVRR